MITRLPVLTLVAVCVVLVAAAARAGAQVNYTEGADLSNGAPTALGTIASGSNSVNGTLSASSPPFGTSVTGDTADAFSVVVPAGVRITSIIVYISGYNSTATPGAVFECTTAGAAVNAFNISSVTQSFNLVTGANGLLPGTYAFRVRHLLTPGFIATSVACSYGITIQAETCYAPEPQVTGVECGIRIRVPANGPRLHLIRWSPGAPTELAIMQAGQTDYVDPKAPGETASYRVSLDAADNPCGGTQGYISFEYSGTATLPVDPARVTGIVANGCMLNWGDSGGAQVMDVILQERYSAAEIFRARITPADIPYHLPASFNPFPLLGGTHEAFWRIESHRTCGGFESTLSIGSTAFSNNFTVLGTLGQPTLDVVNGPCSVVIYPHVDAGASSVTVIRSQLPSGGSVTLNNVALPYFEDTTAAPGNTYVYSLQAVGCNTVTAISQLTVQRSPVGGARPNVRAVEAQTAMLSAGSIPMGPMITAAWRRGGTSANDPTSRPVQDGDGGGRFSGAATSTLTIQRVVPDDTDTYWCVFTNPCGQTVASFNLFLADGCRGDFNRSGSVTVQDIFAFLSSWFAGCP